MSDASKQASDAEMSSEKRAPKSPQSGINIESNYSNGIKMLIERMESLDIEEENFVEENPEEDDEEWALKYREKLKTHLIDLINESSE